MSNMRAPEMMIFLPGGCFAGLHCPSRCRSLHSDAYYAERKLATPRGKGYTSVSNMEPQETDRFYDDRLRTDGWHLDEVEDDDELDFALPPSRSRPPASRCPAVCSCAPCVIM